MKTTRQKHLAMHCYVNPPSKPHARLSPHPPFPSRLSSQTLLSCTVLRTRLPLKAGAYCSTFAVSPQFLNLPSFALYAAFPRSDYYDGSATTERDRVPYTPALRHLPVASPVAP